MYFPTWKTLRDLQGIRDLELSVELPWENALLKAQTYRSFKVNQSIKKFRDSRLSWISPAYLGRVKWDRLVLRSQILSRHFSRVEESHFNSSAARMGWCPKLPYWKLLSDSQRHSSGQSVLTAIWRLLLDHGSLDLQESLHRDAEAPQSMGRAASICWWKPQYFTP